MLPPGLSHLPQKPPELHHGFPEGLPYLRHHIPAMANPGHAALSGNQRNDGSGKRILRRPGRGGGGGEREGATTGRPHLATKGCPAHPAPLHGFKTDKQTKHLSAHPGGGGEAAAEGPGRLPAAAGPGTPARARPPPLRPPGRAPPSPGRRSHLEALRPQ